MIGIKLYFCKKCQIFTDPDYWKYDTNSNRPKGKCVRCGNENPKTMKEVELIKSSKPSLNNDFKTKLEKIYTACNDERVFEIQNRISDLLKEISS